LRRAHLFGACEGLNLSRACGGLIFWAPAAGYYLPRLRRANFFGACGGPLSSAPAAGYFFSACGVLFSSAPAVG